MKKRIIFMGTPSFAAFILMQLLEQQDNFEVVAVVSQPDKPVGRKRVLEPTPVKVVALEHDIPVLQPNKIGDAFEELERLKPDLIITAAYGQFVPTKILELPLYKAINVHGSLLPKHRGGAPIHRAIMEGDTKTGITIMYMVKKMDAGDMLSQEEIAIEDNDTLETMYLKLQVVGAELLLTTLPALFAGTLTPIAQDETEVTVSPNIAKAECQINWSLPARAIFNHVRGLSPAPATFTTINNQNIKVFSVQLVDVELHTAKPGEIIVANSQACHVATGSDNQAIALESIQFSGKKRQDITSIMNGVGKTILIEGAQFE